MSRAAKSSKYDKVGYWLKWITAAKKAAKKTHWPDSRAAYAEYEYKKIRQEDGNGDNQTKRSYPIYWASSQILLASWYGKTPTIKSKRAFGIEDEMALTQCLIADRLGQYLIQRGHFDDALLAACGDLIHASKATTQLIYTTETEMHRVPLQAQEVEGKKSYSVQDSTDAYDGEIEEDDTGAYGQVPKAIEATQQITLAAALFDEMLHTPQAKSNAEIVDWAYKFSLSKEEAEEKFNTNVDGTTKGLSLPYKKPSDDDSQDYDSDDDSEDDSPGSCLEGWEIYCSGSKSVYWVCEDYKDGILASERDPMGLEGFFPSPPFIFLNKPRKSLYPTPTFVYLEATVNQLHLLYYRMFKLIDGVRRRALVMTDNADLVQALNKIGDQEFIQAGEVADILAKGGINNLIQYVDVKELVDCLSETMNIEEHFKNTFFEWFGVPEVMRGNSDPSKTAEAVSIESESAVNRFRYNKKQIVDLARNSAEMMLDCALEVFSDDKIARICGYQYLEPGKPGIPAQPPSQQSPQGTPEVPPKLGHKERFFDALKALRLDEERIVRIDFETDATSFRDEQRELERQKLISDTVLQGLATIGGIQHPEFAHIALTMLLAVVNAMGGSSQSEDLIRQAVSDLEKSKDAPAPPPPPDYEGMKVQVASAAIQQKAQAEQLKAQNASRETDIKQMSLMLDKQAHDFGEQLAQARFQLETQKETSAAQTKAFEVMLEKALVAIEQERVDIERYKAQAQAMLSTTEEIRLAKEASTEALAKVTDFLAMHQESASQKPVEQKAPQVTVINDVKPHTIGHNFIRDAQGNLLRIEPDKTQ